MDNVAPSIHLRRAAAGALILLWIIVVSGATTRLTGSGLGCSDWPTCNGTRPVPELEIHGIIEFTNRMISLPTTVFVVATVWLARRKVLPGRPDIRFGAWGALVGVAANVVLGAFLIRMELPPELVSTHFVLSIWTLFAATLAWYCTRSTTRVRLAPGWSLPRIGALVLLTLAVLTIGAGVLTTASGPHSGATDPSLGIDRLGIGGLAVTFHARLAYAFAGAVIVMTLWLRRHRAGAMDLAILAGLVAAQITLGEIQYRTGLPWWVVLAHVSLAGLIWIVTCRIAIDAAAQGTDRVLPGSLGTNEPITLRSTP